METALSLGSVILVGVGLGCCFVGRRADVMGVAVMAVMTLGMFDTMILGDRLLSRVGWFAVYCVLAAGQYVRRDETGLRLPRAAHLIVMAVLTTALPSMAATDVMSGAGRSTVLMSGMDMGPTVSALSGERFSSALLITAVVVAVGAHVVFALWAARRRCGAGRVELLAGGLSIVVMASMAVV
ncbi:hypothetical protein KVH15_21945 [Streptomyces olivaceus]|uniref:hypothetical protein n=1 Tax=Streptomyces olivaceus TaxID=47716 RepID=UPI001CCEEA0C|nr:hypothetical protein [Streptomyces olivaceus]MBZ6083670.1 hypothetical protein [Streptomyces olivaceus]